MPIYTCECCKYTTTLKTQFDRHNSTTKHIKNLALPHDVGTPTMNDNTEAIDMLFEEISALKIALDECKQEITAMKNASPTYAPPTQTTPHSIVISQAPPPPPEEKKEDETCNPIYIAKKLNADPKYDNTPHIAEFFSIIQDHVHFDFDFEDLEDQVLSQGSDFLVQHVINFVKEQLKEGVALPFLYYKSSWYVKEKTGWERQEKSNNKGIKPDGKGYKWGEPCRSFIFIFANRFNAYCKQELPDTEKNRTLNSEVWKDILTREVHNERTIQHPLRSLLTVNTI